MWLQTIQISLCIYAETVILQRAGRGKDLILLCPGILCHNRFYSLRLVQGIPCNPALPERIDGGLSSCGHVFPVQYRAALESPGVTAKTCSTYKSR